MFNRKDASVALALCAMLATAGYATANDVVAPTLSLDSQVANLQEAAPRSLLMGGLDQIGAAKPLDQLGINIYGWVEGGYTANLRNNKADASRPGPFTQEVGHHVALNQIDLRVERVVDMKKWDVGGMVEFLYGTDSNYIQANGMELQTNGAKHLDNDDNPGEKPILDIPQAYVDVAIPVGNGLKVRAGKFVTLMSMETIAPVNNPFYTHSYIFNAVNFTNTGVLLTYFFNDQWSVSGGFSRGWNQSTEDNNGDSVDAIGQIEYTPNKKLSARLNFSVGPENTDDSSHYRTAINPVVTYKVTDRLSVGLDGLYIYDGRGNGFGYGDVWGAALYAGYRLDNDGMFTLNGRVEKLHDFMLGIGEPVNLYEATAGLTIVPMPKNPIGKNLIIRPEVRYDFSDYRSNVFTTGNRDFKDNWTAAVDVIFTF